MNFATSGQVIARPPPSHYVRSRVVLNSATSDIAPAGKSLRTPWPLRFLRDLAAAATAPYRLLKLTKVTKDLVAEIALKSNELSEDGIAGRTLKAMLPKYIKSHVVARTDPEAFRNFMNTTLNIFTRVFSAEIPFEFQPYHQAVRGPDVDYYEWGNNFFRPMIKYRSARVEGLEQIANIQRTLANGDNIVFLANHQTEADPQALSLLFELHGFQDLAERVIFVAGHKVTTDPVAIPFSMGRNLLTIISKKYLETFSREEREEKTARNMATVAAMSQLFNEGGNIFWVAPSGGRDRRTGKDGTQFEPAKFDEQSVGLFYVIGQKAEKISGRKTHYHPLAMWTHQLVPPPDGTQASVGEARSAGRASVGIEIGPEIDPEQIGGRKRFSAAAEAAVRKHYEHLDSLCR